MLWLLSQAALEKDKPAAGKKGGDKRDRSKSPKKGGGGKKTPDPPAAKKESKLRKRGEEDLDNKYIGKIIFPVVVEEHSKRVEL